jgi:hypothetical protein
MADITGEKVLNVGEDAHEEKAFISRAADPVISPNYATPGDFAAQYPTPLDTNEFIAMCEEVSLLGAIPEVRTALKQHTWREIDELGFNSGSSYIAFQDGYCPEEFSHTGDNMTVTLKNLGAKKSLSISDIMHSAAVASAGWNGINQLIGGFPAGDGLPGASDMATFQREIVSDLKEKEIRLATTLVLNGWDRLLAVGDSDTNALEFSGIEKWASNMSCTMHTRSENDIAASGTFSAAAFDRFLSESCAKPTHILGHPATIQEMLSSYFQLGYQGSEVVNFADGSRITPGYNFAGFVNTGIGRLPVVADTNFTRTTSVGNTFNADLWALRMVHNGEPLVYRTTQIPLALKDLVPGCTAISFEVWTKTALVIKMCCAQSRWQGIFTGRIASTCAVIQ